MLKKLAIPGGADLGFFCQILLENSGARVFTGV